MAKVSRRDQDEYIARALKLTPAQTKLFFATAGRRKPVVSGRSWRTVYRLSCRGLVFFRERYVPGATPGLTGRDEYTVWRKPDRDIGKLFSSGLSVAKRRA